MKTKKMIILALLVAAAIILNSIDIIITMPLPFVKLGIAHLITILVLYLYGKKEMTFVIIFKVLLISLIWGKFGLPTFYVSLAGNTATLLFLFLAYKHFNIVSLSIGAAFFNNLGQIITVYFLFIKKEEMFFIFGILMLLGMVSGFLIGISAKEILKRKFYDKYNF